MEVYRISRRSAIIAYSIFILITLQLWLIAALMFAGHERLTKWVYLGNAIMPIGLWYSLLRMVQEIRWKDERTLEFRGAIGSTKIPVTELVSIKKGWFIGGKIRRRGTLEFFAQVFEFEKLLKQIKAMNPAVEIKGFLDTSKTLTNP